MTPEAVLCMVCGYNLKTGQYFDLPNQQDKKRLPKKCSSMSLLVAAGLVAILLLSLTGYIFYEPIMEDRRETWPSRLR